MKILGIDPGLVQTGFGIISTKNDESKLIDYGIIKPSPKDTLANRLLTIFNDVCEIINDHNPQIFSIEDIFSLKLFYMQSFLFYHLSFRHIVIRIILVG